MDDGCFRWDEAVCDYDALKLDNTGDHQAKARIQRPSIEKTNQKEETKVVTAHQPLDDKQWTPPSLVSTGRDREKRYENTDDTVKKQH